MSTFLDATDIKLLQENNWRMKELLQILKDSGEHTALDYIEDTLAANYEVLDTSEPSHVGATTPGDMGSIIRPPAPVDEPLGVVGLFVGHNKGTGASAIDGTDEWESRFAVFQMASKKLLAEGYEAHVILRDGSLGYTSAMRSHGRSAETRKLQLSLEGHFNAFNGSAQGAEILVASTKTRDTLGKAFVEATQEYYPHRVLRGGGAKLMTSGRGYGFNKYQPCPSGVYEPFFGDSSEWWEYSTPELQEREADYVVAIVENFFRITRST